MPKPLTDSPDAPDGKADSITGVATQDSDAQAERFATAARELGVNLDEVALKDALRRIAPRQRYAVTLSADPSPALVQIADLLAEIGDAPFDNIEGALEVVGVNIDFVPASGAGHVTYKVSLAGLDEIRRAAARARKL